MARLRRHAPRWDRFSKWPPGAARLALALVALLLVASVLTFPADHPTAPDAPAAPAAAIQAAPGTEAKRDTDLQLYDRVAERVALGEDYHRAAVEEHRARDFPVRPGLAVRLPGMAYLTAWLGPWGLLGLGGVLALAVLLAWFVRLQRDPGGKQHTTVVLLLLAIGMFSGLKPQYIGLHEVWAGLLMALAFGLHRRRRHWKLAWLASAAALAIRELALPFVLLLGALALARRHWREAGAWAALVLLFFVGLWIHLQAVGELTSAADPASPGWLALRGLGGLTKNIVECSALHMLPGWLAAPLAILPLLGWAGWKSDAGLFGLLLCAGYGLMFMIAGRDNNFYWALVIMPVWFVGYAFLPMSLASLWNSARDR